MNRLIEENPVNAITSRRRWWIGMFLFLLACGSVALYYAGYISSFNDIKLTVAAFNISPISQFVSNYLFEDKEAKLIRLILKKKWFEMQFKAEHNKEVHHFQQKEHQDVYSGVAENEAIYDKLFSNNIAYNSSNRYNIENAVEINLKAQREVENKKSTKCLAVKAIKRFNCHPEPKATQSACEARGCCWNKANTGNWKVRRLPNFPSCFYPANYTMYNVTGRQKTETGYAVNLTMFHPSYFPSTVMELVMYVMYETRYRLRIKIVDPRHHRWEVPIPVPTAKTKASDPLYSIDVSETGSSFWLKINRLTTGGASTTILDTTDAGAFLYADQFLQLSYYLPSKYIYGLGEHRDSFLLNTDWNRYAMWTHDKPPVENKNLYGSHPFYLSLESNGNAHGVFLLNSNAMDVTLQPTPAITWRAIGGIIDLYMLLGPGPDQVIQQYTEVIGRSVMPPYWGLGFHLCKFGYKNVNETMDVVNRLRKYGIPQDTQWTDYDYMVGHMDFTSDTERFGDQAGMVREFHRRGMHYVMIVDPGISSSQMPGTYYPFDLGKEMGIFINDTHGDPIIGKVWPGNTVFPDFTNPRTTDYWTTLVQDFHDIVDFDGMWIDMDEPVSFINGSIHGCPENSTIQHPPYMPNIDHMSLEANTLCATARQHWGLHYDVHNLYGLTETIASYKALVKTRGKRPFVISRSTFPSQGHWGGHWEGDNLSSFYDMFKSIAFLLNSNIFGMSLSGSDICGFRGNSTAELCQRWLQLGAFYPFSRDHNDRTSSLQDPAIFGRAVAESTRKVFLTRYSLLPYLYTLFYKSSRFGQTVARPVFFEYPKDVKCYGIDYQFLWGPALMITPVLVQNATTVSGYFPADTWYDFYSGARLVSSGHNVTLDAPMDKINLHVRGGYILPMQKPAVTTTLSRQNNFTLLVTLSSTGEASGDLFWDNGDIIDTVNLGFYNLLKFTCQKGSCKSRIVKNGYRSAKMILSLFTICGVPSAPTAVTLNGVWVDFKYIELYEKLVVSDFTVNLMKNFTLIWR